MCFLPPLKIFNTRLLYFCDAVFKFIFTRQMVIFTAIRNPKKAECINFTGYERLALKTVKVLLYRFIFASISYNFWIHLFSFRNSFRSTERALMFLVYLTPSLPECLMEFCKASLTFESADEILWCDHSNESSLPVLSYGAICLSKF